VSKLLQGDRSMLPHRKRGEALPEVSTGLRRPNRGRLRPIGGLFGVLRRHREETCLPRRARSAHLVPTSASKIPKSEKAVRWCSGSSKREAPVSRGLPKSNQPFGGPKTSKSWTLEAHRRGVVTSCRPCRAYRRRACRRRFPRAARR
jgi:hypothetical protein